MNKRWYGVLAVSTLALFPLSLLAHTGVGEIGGFSAGFGHPLGGLDHLLAMVAVGLWAAQMGGRALWFVPGAFASFMLVGGMIGLAGVPLPYVEQAIVVSVLVLGVLIAAAFRFSISAGAGLVATFALFHGFAHGAEMPLASSVLSYSIGFFSGTALLHGAGIAVGMVLQRMKREGFVRLAGGAITLAGVYLASV